MKLSFSSVSVYIFLLLILIVEGLGLPFGRFVARYLICVFPLLLFGMDILHRKTIHIPARISLLFILFSFTTAISTITSVNVQTAFEHQLYYLGVFLLFIYVYNHQAEIKKSFPLFAIVSTSIVLCYAVFINWFLPDTWSFLIPISGYQFAYLTDNSGSHYSFGAFILMPLILAFSFFLEKPRKLMGSFVLLLFILLLFSFLRSAYIAIIVVVIINVISALKKKNHPKSICIFITSVIVVSSVLFFLAITNFNSKLPIVSNSNKFFTSHFDLLKYKSLGNGRLEFARQALEAIRNRPLTGFGSYNFYYAAMRFAPTYDTATGTSHNIFIDIFVENGLMGGVTFAVLIILLIINSWKAFIAGNVHGKSIFGLLIALFVLFQFGHYHKFYFLFILFFFTAGLLYFEKNDIQDKLKITFITSGILFLLNACIITSFILLTNQKYSASYMIYPLSVRANQALIQQYHESAQYDKTDTQLKRYHSLYPEEPFALDFIGNFYSNKSAQKEAIRYYEQAFRYAPRDIRYLVFIYEELEKIRGTTAAKQYVVNYLSEYKIYSKNSPWDSNKQWFEEWCTSKKIECTSYSQ